MTILKSTTTQSLLPGKLEVVTMTTGFPQEVVTMTPGLQDSTKEWLECRGRIVWIPQVPRYLNCVIRSLNSLKGVLGECCEQKPHYWPRIVKQLVIPHFV